MTFRFLPSFSVGFVMGSASTLCKSYYYPEWFQCSSNFLTSSISKLLNINNLLFPYFSKLKFLNTCITGLYPKYLILTILTEDASYLFLTSFLSSSLEENPWFVVSSNLEKIIYFKASLIADLSQMTKFLSRRCKQKFV